MQMKTSTTANRLMYLMKELHLKQVDILNRCEPFCKKYNVKLGRNDLSQYVSGKVEPGQDKLSILGLALNVSEAWLMGYDVPMRKEKTPETSEKFSQIELNIIEDFRTLDEEGQKYLLQTIDIVKYRYSVQNYIQAAARGNSQIEVEIDDDELDKIVADYKLPEDL